MARHMRNPSYASTYLHLCPENTHGMGVFRAFCF
jgi:hypothetical protein